MQSHNLLAPKLVVTVLDEVGGVVNVVLGVALVSVRIVAVVAVHVTVVAVRGDLVREWLALRVVTDESLVTCK